MKIYCVINRILLFDIININSFLICLVKFEIGLFLKKSDY